ncbi:MAG: cyclic pyranopterin monophosphate synthase MoaC [Myxococcota bacterium]
MASKKPGPRRPHRAGSPPVSRRKVQKPRKRASRRKEKRLSHLDARGHARMVDVGNKEVTEREAVASARITLKAETLKRIRDGKIEKGDVFAAARLAGILGVKATPRLIPLCHPLPITNVTLDFKTRSRPARIELRCRVKTRARTGVEMEALTGVVVAALTLYDMCKAVDRGMTIASVQLERKAGGKSGLFVRDLPDD